MPANPPFQPQTRRPDAVLTLWPRPAGARWCPAHRTWHPWSPSMHPADVAMFEGTTSDVFADLQRWEPPLSAVVDLVPREVRDDLRQVPHDCWFACLKAVYAVPALRDRLRTDLVLAVLLATRATWTARAVEELRCRLGGRRRDLLPLLGLAPQPWMLRAMRRTDAFALAYGGVDRVLAALSSPDKKVRMILQHAERLSAASYRLRPELTEGTLRDVESRRRERALVRPIRLTVVE